MEGTTRLPIATMPPAVERSQRIKRIQRTALTLLVLAGCVNYVDRAALSIGNVLIRHDLGLSVADMGLLLSAFLWAYAFAQLPAGGMVDRFGPRRLLTGALALWSLAQALAGLVTGFGQFVVVRAVLGLGEAPQFPSSARVVRDWFGGRDRGTATGIWNTLLHPRHRHLGAAADLPDAGVRLALDVRHHGHRRPGGRSGLVRHLPRTRAVSR